MRFSTAIAIFSLFAASASASVAPLHRRQFPNCANDCLAHPNLGTCKAGDNACLCNNNDFVTSTFDCIEAACKGQELHDAIEGAAALCAASHVTLVSAAGAAFSATAILSSSPSSAPGAQTSGPAASDVTGSTPTTSGSAPTTAPNTGGARASASAAGTALLGLAALALAL